MAEESEALIGRLLGIIHVPLAVILYSSPLAPDNTTPQVKRKIKITTCPGDELLTLICRGRRICQTLPACKQSIKLKPICQACQICPKAIISLINCELYHKSFGPTAVGECSQG